MSALFCLEPVLSSPKVVTRSTEGAQSRERSGAMLNVSRTCTLYGHYIKPMPRSPLPRTLFAMLPILGALLAALAAHRNWPIPLSLSAMAVIALAAAVIYWSAPLSKRKSALPVGPSLRPHPYLRLPQPQQNRRPIWQPHCLPSISRFCLSTEASAREPMHLLRVKQARRIC